MEDGLTVDTPGWRGGWYGLDTPETYVAEGNAYGPDDIEYGLNDHGFRCDDFDQTLAIDRWPVLFAGCSITFGTGVRLEESYPALVTEKLRREGLSAPLWNIAHIDASPDSIARLLYLALPRLRPNALWIMFPPANRREWVEETAPPTLRTLITGDEVPYGKRLLGQFFTAEKVSYEFARNLALIDSLCRINGVRYFWTRWDWISNNSARIEGMRYMHPTISARYRPIGVPLDRKARDRFHPGSEWHRAMADVVYAMMGPDAGAG